MNSQQSTQSSSTQEKINEVNSDDESSDSDMDSAESNNASDPILPPLPDFMSDNHGKDNKSKSPVKNPFRGSGNKVLRSPPPRPKVKLALPPLEAKNKQEKAAEAAQLLKDG